MRGILAYRRPLAVAAVLCFYAGLVVVAVDQAFDRGASRGGTVAAGASYAGSGATGARTGSGSAGTGDDLTTGSGSDGSGLTGGSSGGTPGRATRSGTGGTGLSDPSAGSGGTDGQQSGAAPATRDTSPLKVGIRIANKASVGAIAAALGSRGVGDIDQRGYAETLVADVNAHGGVGGRKLDAFYVEVDITGLVANADASDQSDCERFTDAKVFAVLTSIPLGPVLGPCLAQRGIPLIIAAPDEFNAHDLAKLKGFEVMAVAPNLHRQAAIITDALDRQGYYKDAKVGLLWYDKPTFRQAVEEAYLPELSRRHVNLVDQVSMTSYTNSEQFSSAVLRFKAKGIDHVQFVDVSGLLALQFMQYAESQQYHPRYGLSSANSLSAIQTAVSPAQLRNSIGVGWMPSLDTPEHPGLSSTAKRCVDALKADGRQMNDRVAVALALWTCEVIHLFKAAMEHAPDQTTGGYVAGLAALGESYVPADTFVARFGPERYDAPGAARFVAFDDGCTCFRYTSGVYAIP